MTTVEYTDEQRAALETRDVSVALDAGAGCGKTFVLTERYLSHLKPSNDGPPPCELTELVAITFTDAAAREMRGRIREKCRERFESAPADEAPFWRRLLRSLDAARVSTIHAFCADLVRRHAIELGIDPAFQVAEPAAAETMLTDAIDRLLRSRLAGRGDGPDEELIDAAAVFGLAGLRSRLIGFVREASDPEFRVWITRQPDDLIDAWLLFYRDVVAPEFAAELRNDPALLRLRELLQIATPVKPEFVERTDDLRTVLRELDDPARAHETLKRLQPLLGTRIPGTNKMIHTNKDWPDTDTKKAFTAALQNLRKKLDNQPRSGDEPSMRRAAELGLRLARLAAEAEEEYTRAKREAGVLDQDDLLGQARRLLTAPEFEATRRRFADKIRVLLVDEFQDTDRTQVDIVRAIVGEDGGPLGGGRLFFVGDFKQSIYRFRGAEPAVFRELRESAAERGRLPLSLNFRSQPAVLDFVNALFGELFGEAYTPLRPAQEQSTPTPAVEFLWTPMPLASGAEDPPARIPVERQRTAEARSLAGRLRRIIDDAEPIVADRDGGARPARPGDIALLFRALSNVAIYEDALREAGLEYYLVGGHAFYAQQEVFDVLNLLRAIDSACDDISLAGVLRSPLFGLRDETIFWIAERSGHGLARINRGLFDDTPAPSIEAEQLRRVAHARAVLGELRAAKDRLGAAELMRLALEATAYEATLLAEFLGERKLANVGKLQEQARQSDASGGGLPAFLRQLTEYINQPPKEALAATNTEDHDAVRLMTVHQSKGLEFPIVVLPDLNGRAQGERDTVAFDRRLGPLVKPPGAEAPVGIDIYRANENRQAEAERDRLFYVACTRAADRLILSACLDDPTKPEGPWLKRLARKFELSNGQTIDHTPGGPLVTVTAPSGAPETEANKKAASIASVLENLSPEPAESDPPAGVRPIAIDPEDLLTFSVSRLDGALRRSEEEAPLGKASPSDGLDPRRFGTLVHAVIERLDPLEEDLRTSITRWSRSLAPLHLIRQVEAGETACRELVERFTEGPCWQSMCSAERLEREVEFLLPWPLPGSEGPPALLRGYIDALLRGPDGSLRVVDYKTNRVDAESVPAAAEGYRLQLALYALAIESARGRRPESLTLSFLHPGADYEIPWDGAERDASIRAINRAILLARTEAVATP